MKKFYKWKIIYLLINNKKIYLLIWIINLIKKINLINLFVKYIIKYKIIHLDQSK